MIGERGGEWGIYHRFKNSDKVTRRTESKGRRESVVLAVREKKSISSKFTLPLLT